MYRLALAVLFFGNYFSDAQTSYEVDVCIYGGTSAGVIAAYTAQKLGKTAILIEPGKRLGGMTSGGLGYTDIGNKSAITGLARDFYRRVGTHYRKFEQWTFEPKVAESIFKDYAWRGGFKVLYETRLKSVIKDGSIIREIILENSIHNELPNIIVKAKMFIDCGYEGDLMAKAGVQYRIGREDNVEYNETLNGFQLLIGHQLPDGIDPYKISGKPQSGLLWGINNDTVSQIGNGDKKIQAYNYRICLTSNQENMLPIERPEDYDSSKYELLLRLFAAYPSKRKLNDYFIVSRMPNNKTDINNRGGFSSDMIGMNYNYPESSYAEREQIIKQHKAYTKGLLYFYGHDKRVPEPLRKEMELWGYPKDEYIENDNWSPQLYIRESRRMIGEYVMTQANCQGKHHVNDGVGLAAYTMDSHNCSRLVVNGQVKNEGNVDVGGFGPYPISYRAIIPKQDEAENLLVPVCLSATHIAYGSIRMEPVFMVLGQSAATAAVLAIEDNISVQAINIRKLQEQLKFNPLADSSQADILVDNEDHKHLKITGKKWRVKKEGGYGNTFLTQLPDDKNIFYARFTPPRIPAGDYCLYIYIPKLKGNTKFMTVAISDGIKTKERILSPGSILVEGQTSGEWISLGQYNIIEGNRPYVEISTKNATGIVVADAVMWVSKPSQPSARIERK